MTKRLLASLLLLTLTVSPVWASYDFTASGHQINVGDHAVPATGTLAFWMKADSDLSALTPMFFSWRDFSPFTCAFHITTFTASWYAGWYDNGGPTDYRVTTSDSPPAVGVWTLVGLTWDDTANETKLFINGSQIGSTESTLATCSPATTNKAIGNDASGNPANSKLAHMTMWNSVLSGANWTSLLTCAPSTVGAPLHYWPMLINANDYGSDPEDGSVVGAVLSSGDGPTLLCGGSPPSPSHNLLMTGVGN